MTLGKEAIINRFGLHGGDPEITAKHEALRGASIAFAEYLDLVIPDGHSKDVMNDHLKTALMWSHFALAEEAPVIDPAPEKPAVPKPGPRPIRSQ